MQQNSKRSVRALSVQVGMATSYWASNYAKGGSIPEELPEDIQKMLQGIQRYHTHDYERPKVDLESIWQESEANIFAIPGHEYAEGNEVVLLVPSLINKAYVFDLNEQRSMLHWLAAQGVNPYLLSWGEPTADAGQASMAGIVLERLVPAMRFLAQQAGAEIHALGYCMGGTLLTAAAVQKDMPLKSIILLAAPWDFHAGSQALLNRVKFWAPSAFPAIDEKAVLGMDWVQTVFASLDPGMAVRKFSKFYDMEQEGEAVQLFVAVEDWLNDGVDLPGDVAQHCIRDWFIKNAPACGEWILGGHVVRPENIQCPALIIASDKDRLVEYEAAVALGNKIDAAEIVNPSCGHIGMIAGRNSVENVWSPIANWLKR